MVIRSYEEINSMQLDILREIGSIGTGNAVTSLSSLLSVPVSVDVPDIGIEGFNEVVNKIGNPEDIVAAVLVVTKGDMHGIMMVVMDRGFTNAMLKNLIGRGIESFDELDEMGISALTEVGNIMISSYVSAISALTKMDIELLVPAVSVNMLGGIMTVPMARLGHETDSLMMIRGSLGINGEKHNNTILMFPDIESLNRLMDKLVNNNGN